MLPKPYTNEQIKEDAKRNWLPKYWPDAYLVSDCSKCPAKNHHPCNICPYWADIIPAHHLRMVQREAPHPMKHREDPAIQNYFIQTQPSPNEGAHAQEVTRPQFLISAEENPYVRITYDADTMGLYLRFDLPDVDGV